MKLGILSDSHGQVTPIRQALHVLERAGAEAIVHCGDVGGLEVLEELAGWRAWFVWGNTDEPRPPWRAQVQTLGLPWPEGPLELSLDGKRVGVFHGHERGFHQAIREARYDYLLHGHTHQHDDYYEGRMRVINPGALHRASVRTVALLDLQTDELRFLELDKS
ncbi:MAG TPA: YfcE family phosphodiesterase [Phycisphaerae bacterium]|jgi:putative phosphoesterase|nr:metallophosphoesterase family protein [Phycisphaerae bacterium]HOB75144.1 YfcE family phosphodiesterase [Phycisphaerae bacterium]HOJ54634.1 YfcE family phosphodiesterase [Phycisphaerae bacterium]HOL27260.1 YfcE family phosphodiesterase [Phycisphaerae bacterium]HPP21060.1 YfcE family phosphodiesterase [Phycisphaerae bacterium]